MSRKKRQDEHEGLKMKSIMTVLALLALLAGTAVADDFNQQQKQEALKQEINKYGAEKTAEAEKAAEAKKAAWWPWTTPTSSPSSKLIVCPNCGGAGKVQVQIYPGSNLPSMTNTEVCKICKGTGQILYPPKESD
jgi:DnaJ-class molecular chaperone